ncbi:hypothetical protein BFL38_11835 [Brachyspira hampsonii]|uniref:YitT family protein n=2 Tax=Brachyspira hampsonii TaxID=1287055 RepID=A0A1E5NIZ3_9SPIR|nr:DUF6198 family protein [Brachyspira hampsonii]OEJ16128.1 hypothetical protein BFL38_11835 [Brachyspira hampsonii]
MITENNITLNDHNNHFIISGELALILVVIMNSFGVVLMLYSGSGISAISSVPYAFSEVIKNISLGTFTYIFQTLLVLVLMILRKKFVGEYLFSFAVGFFFGKFIDIHSLWINHLPLSLTYRIIYFIISYIILSFGIALSNRCGLPIIPTDLFPRELSNIIKVPYSKIKIIFDVSSLLTTALITFIFLGHIKGLGIGTVLAAFTMGKSISFIGSLIDKKIEFVPYIKKLLHKENKS